MARTTSVGGLNIPLPNTTLIMEIGIGIVVIAIIVAIVLILKNRKKYDVLAEIHAKTATTGMIGPKDKVGNVGEIISFTPAAYLYDKKTGTWHLRLRKFKHSIPPPDYKCRKQVIHQKYKEIVYLWQEGPNNFIPFIPETDYEKKKLDLNLVDSEATWLAAKTAAEIRETYNKPGWFEKYGAFLMFAVFAIMVIILIYTVLDKFTILQDVSANLAQAAKYLAMRPATPAP